MRIVPLPGGARGGFPHDEKNPNIQSSIGAICQKTAQQHDLGQNSNVAGNKEQKTRRQLQSADTHR
jgi:hypothetical protein